MRVYKSLMMFVGLLLAFPAGITIGGCWNTVIEFPPIFIFFECAIALSVAPLCVAHAACGAMLDAMDESKPAQGRDRLKELRSLHPLLS